jgi:probable HAF family extracellular repeat protein
MTRPQTRFRFLLFAITWLLSLAIGFERPRAQSSPGPYTLTDLGTLGGGSAYPEDMNEAGQITGYSTLGSGQTRAFLWDGGQMANLGTMGGSASVGKGINSHGHVAGYSSIVSGGTGIAALWRDGAVINLTPDIPTGQGSQAVAINDNDQVIGLIGWGEAFVWQNGSRTTLGGLGGGAAFVTDINNVGTVVGSSQQHAVLWENGVLRDLGVFPGDEEAGATAINNNGVIVGYSGRTDFDTYEQFYKPFIWQDGRLTAIAAPSSEAYASAINDLGDIVGTMRAGGAASPWHAYIYKDGVVTNLNAVKPSGTGLHLAYAQAINDDGQIAGVAIDGQGRYHGFLLTPGGVAPPPVLPTLRINDVHVLEGKSGTTAATFTVTLSQPATGTVLVNFITANGSAIAGDDYIFTSGAVRFNAGETSKTITVAVAGDRRREPDETFAVNLSAADGATIIDAKGACTIHNDDN